MSRRSCGVLACLRWAAKGLDYCDVHATGQAVPIARARVCWASGCCEVPEYRHKYCVQHELAGMGMSPQQRAATRRGEEAANRDAAQVLVFTVREARALQAAVLDWMDGDVLAADNGDLGRAWRVLLLQLSVLEQPHPGGGRRRNGAA